MPLPDSIPDSAAALAESIAFLARFEALDDPRQPSLKKWQPESHLAWFVSDACRLSCPLYGRWPTSSAVQSGDCRWGNWRAKQGRIGIDGTKVKANASKRKAMSYGRMREREAQLKAEIERISTDESWAGWWPETAAEASAKALTACVTETLVAITGQ